jgi:hypothetical protein
MHHSKALYNLAHRALLLTIGKNFAITAFESRSQDGYSKN